MCVLASSPTLSEEENGAVVDIDLLYDSAQSAGATLRHFSYVTITHRSPISKGPDGAVLVHILVFLTVSRPTQRLFQFVTETVCLSGNARSRRRKSATYV